MSIKFSVIEERDFLKSKWSGGTTEQIFIYPPDAVYKEMDFLFRISRASVDISPSEFTRLPGIQRFIMPLDNELVLTHDNITDIRLRPFEAYEFSGDMDTMSKSPAKDFNLMLAKGIAGEMRVLHLEAEKSYRCNAKENIKKLNPNHAGHIKLNSDGTKSEGADHHVHTAEKYFIGFYTPDTGVIIDCEGSITDMPAGSLFFAESEDEADISMSSKTDSRIIVIRIRV